MLFHSFLNDLTCLPELFNAIFPPLDLFRNREALSKICLIGLRGFLKQFNDFRLENFDLFASPVVTDGLVFTGIGKNLSSVNADVADFEEL